jgi:hypothetical protein
MDTLRPDFWEGLAELNLFFSKIFKCFRVELAFSFVYPNDGDIPKAFVDDFFF